MRRSNYGYILLALLVITGLAGTITSTSITSKERKFAASHLKENKTNFLKTIKGLSKTQLDFKISSDRRCIKECVYNIVLSENKLWLLLEKTMKQPANPEKRSQIEMSDDQLINRVENGNSTIEMAECKKNVWKNMDEVIESFKTTRADHIKYIKNTTEDLRNHIIQTSIGWVDCYQLCLVISANNDHFIQQIEELKTAQNLTKQ